jgi:hypothetical protein
MTFKFDNREFDEGLLQKIPEIFYEDDIKDIPSPPDVSNYLVSEVSLEKNCLLRFLCFLQVMQNSSLPIMFLHCTG